MNHRPGKRVTGKLIAAAVGAVGLMGVGADRADAGLTIDVTAVTAIGGAIINNSKSVTFTGVGQTVTLNLIGQIRGTNSISDEAFKLQQGSILTSGALLGDLSFGGTRDDNPGAVDPDPANAGNIVQSNLVDPFDGLASSDGDFVDLDSDGDIDVGSTGSNQENYFVARAPAATNGTNVGNGSAGAGDDRLIGRVKFTYTGGDGSTLANFIVRTDGGNPVFSAAVWAEDGAGKTPDVATYAAGSPVSFQAVPEPTGLALAALGAIGLVARRRSRNR
jgi:MYXO-CTERM domain-containing protein